MPTVRQAADARDDGRLHRREWRKFAVQLPSAAQGLVECDVVKYGSFRRNGHLFLPGVLPTLLTEQDAKFRIAALIAFRSEVHCIAYRRQRGAQCLPSLPIQAALPDGLNDL